MAFPRRTRSFLVSFFYPLLLCGFALLWLGSAGDTAVAQEHDANAEAEIQQAWDRVGSADQYQFRSKIEQWVYPTPSIRNAGRQPEKDVLGLEAMMETDSNRMESTIWPDGTFDPNTGLDLLVENGRSYVRESSVDEWIEIDDISSGVAPAGDPLNFLAGIQNVQSAGADDRTLGDITISLTRYTFDINGPVLGLHIDKLMEQEAIKSGAMPQGISYQQGNNRFYEAVGSGEIWIGSDGYPARLAVEMSFPPEESGERITANLNTDFYDFKAVEAGLVPQFGTAPREWLAHTAAEIAKPDNASYFGWSILMGVTFVLLTIFVLRHAHTKEFYTTIATVVILGMILPPLVQARKVRAYYNDQVVQSQEKVARDAEIEQQTALHNEMFGNDWHPLEDPYAEGRALQAAQELANVQAAQSATASLLASSESDTTADSDNDGATDDDEALWDSCPYLTSSSEYASESDCNGVTDPSDSDGDGLSDYTEIYELGTLPDTADSDGDTIPDTLEVKGFDYNGERWYLNPLKSDTNNDGRSDGEECFVWSASNPDADANDSCADSDGDGTPDLYDFDDDDDQIWDIDDGDNLSVSDVFGRDNPMTLSVDGLAVDKPVLVEVQLRPEDDSLLYASGLILDWPTGDFEGQITRGNETTFATTTDADAYSEDDEASYGDLKVVPLLRITVPYTDGHYANLPVNSDYYGIDRTLDITTGQWLDSTELDSYGITVSDADETSGDIDIYVPVSTMYSAAGERAVGFSATTFYSPTQGTNGVADWGNDHEYSLIWMVQMITDACVADVDEDGDGDTDDETDADCTREDDLTTIHIYEEDWRLTSLTVSEEHGLDTAVMYEDPAQDDDLELDDQLWIYGWNLGNTFTNGLDCDSIDGSGDCVGDGNRDVTIDDIEAKLDYWGTDENNVNQNYTEFVGIDQYIHSGHLGYVAISTTAEILDSHFFPYTDTQEYSSLLFAYETVNRSLGLGDNGGTDKAISLDFSDVDTQTIAGTFLKTYTFDDESGDWDEADEASYYDYLSETLEDNDSYFEATDDSEEALEEQAGKLLWAQNMYITLNTGTTGIVAYDGSAFNTIDFDTVEDSNSFFAYAELILQGVGEINGTAAGSRFGYVAYHYLFSVYDKTTNTSSFWSYIYRMYSVDDYYTQATENSSRKVTKAFNNNKLFGNKVFTKLVTHYSLRMLAVALGIFVAGALIAVVGYIFTLTGDSETGSTITKIGLLVVGIASIAVLAIEGLILLTKMAFTAFIYFQESAGAKVRKLKTARAAYARQYAIHSTWGAAIGIAVAAGIALYTWSTLGWNDNSPEFDQAGAILIATVIVELILAILIFLFPAGTAIALLIELVDAILFVVGLFYDKIDFTLTSWLTEAISDLMYNLTLTAANADDDDRLSMGSDYALWDSSLGFVESNTLAFTLTVTNTLYTTESRSDLKRNTFIQDIDKAGTAHNSIAVGDGDMSDQWINTNDGSFWAEGVGDIKYETDTGVYSTTVLSLDFPLTDSGTGINKDTAAPYFNEAYYLIGEGCWHVFAIAGTEYNCKELSFDGSGSSEMDPFTFDVLPDSLVDFIQLDWNGGSPKFPKQYDQDGDGLINVYYGGTDPDDTTWDSDGDLLSDYYEMTNSFEEEDPDDDDDGLTDWEEIYVYYTDPDNADYDGDGLGDYIEAKVGWLTSYTDENGQQSATRVWSDPYVADLDDDGIGDLQEYIYGFHPSLASDLSAVDSFIQFSDLRLEETSGPLVYLSLDEAEGYSTVVDRAGDSRDFGCSASGGSCPTAEAAGKFDTAMSFDNSDDYLINDELDIELEEFTIAAFVYNGATDNSAQPIFGSTSGFTADSPPSLVIHDNQDITVGFGDGTTWHSISPFHTFVSTEAWNHVAATYDGEQLRILVNGNGVYNEPVAAGALPTSITEMTIGRNGSDYLDGMVDEVLVYDRALDEGEIGVLIAGRYNLNDLYFTPSGGTLSYQATISNTTTAVNTDGFLYAESTMIDPAFPEPTFYLGFDADQRWATFDNSFNVDHDVYCHDDGNTCPTNETTITAVGTSLEFDGADDIAYLPTLTSNSTDASQGGFFFWLYVSSYPDSGEIATVIDTESTADGAVDIYVDESGDLYFDAAGYSAIQMTSAITQSEWVHVAYQRGYVYIDGEQESYSGSRVMYPKIGSGSIGASMDGSNYLTGAIDELVVHHESISTSQLQEKIMVGKYSFGGQHAHAAVKFEEVISTDTTVYSDPSQYSNHAYCETDDTCPSEVTGRSGEGVALDFDGADDYLVQPDSLSVFDRYYFYDGELTLHIYPTAYPDSGEIAYIYDTEEELNGSSNHAPFDLYMDDSGRLVVSGKSGNYYTYKGAIPLNEWTKVKFDFYYDEVDISDVVAQEMLRYIDGTWSNDHVGNAILSYLTSCTDCDEEDDKGWFIGGGRIGNNIAGTAPFEGRIDDFDIELAEHDFDRYERTLGYYDPVNDLIRAECDMLEDCPGLYDGIYGKSASFHASSWLDFNEQLGFARGDYTISLWFYADHAINQTMFSAYDDDGDLGVQLDILSNSQISYTHSLGGSHGHIESSGTTTYTTSTWHHLVAVKDSDNIYLYLNGELADSASGISGTADENLNIRIGNPYDSSSGRDYYGWLDEVAIFDEAATADQAAFLYETRYPALDIPVPYETFSLDSGETKIISGTASVNDPVGASSYAFHQDVEVAIDLETELSYTTYENTDGLWAGYFRFEEVPGDEAFDNLVAYGTGGTAAEVDGTCSGESCPVGGVRGIDGRAAYFDGDDDSLIVDIDSLDSTAEPHIRSLAVWVKGADGTIFDSAGINRNQGFQLNMGSFTNESRETTYFDMPRNEWTHLAVTIDDNDEATVYVNATAVITGVEQTADDARSWAIGSNFGPQSHFLGYLDELKLFETELTAAEISDLYENIGATFRFEFDEEYGETNFVDQIEGYVAEPIMIECADVTFSTLSGSGFDALLTQIVLELDGDTLLYDLASNYGETTADLNITTSLCGADQSLVANGVYSNSSEITFASAETISVSNSGTTTTTMSNGGQSLTLVYEIGESYQETSPLVGTDGRIGNTAYFTGEDDGHIEVTTAGLGNFSDEDFTLMGWIKTDETGVGILTKSDGDSSWEAGERSFYVADDGTLQFHGQGQGKINSTKAITDSSWHHFAFVWDSTLMSGEILVDGLNVSDSSDYAPSDSDNTSDQLRFGAPNHSVATDYFAGQLDEIVLYSGRALTDIEVYDSYQQEARWYRESADFIVTIDDDYPTIEVKTDYQYRADGYIQLVATADDATSGVARVRYKYKHDNNGSYGSWTEAPLCADTTAEIYCPSFTSSGEGDYLVLFHLIDAVGNVTETTDPFHIYVDTEAPYMYVDNDHNNDLGVTVTELSIDSWELAMSGDMEDVDIVNNEIAGSGVYTPAIYVNVYNEDGTLIGVANQTATYDDGDWTIDYVATGEALAGYYDVYMTSEDVIGNSRTTHLGSFPIDLQTPVIETALDLWGEGVISQTNTITGVIVDQAEYSQPMLNFHFEELSGESYFYDYGQLNLHVDCTSDCPQTTASGVFGRGLAFNGIDQTDFVVNSYPISDVVNFDVGDPFSIAFWVKADTTQPAATSTTNSLVEKWNGTGAYPYAIRYHNQTSSDYGRISASVFDGTTMTEITSTVTITDGAFHHVALTHDGESYQLYIDGRGDSAMTVASTSFVTNTADLSLGHIPGDDTTLFSGTIDQFSVYDKLLAAEHIYAMAQTDVSGVGRVQVALEVIDFDGYPDNLIIDGREDDVSWSGASYDQESGLGSAWTYDLGTKENWYYIHVRGEDDDEREHGAENVWRGLIDHKAPNITFTGSQAYGGSYATSTYDFTITDFLLDESTLVHPCGAGDLVELTYDSVPVDAPHYGLAYEISGSCTLAGHTVSETVTICDAAYHCSSETVDFGTDEGVNTLFINSPTHNGEITPTNAITITGELFAKAPPFTVEVSIDSELIDTIVFTSGITETTWSAVWEMMDAGDHTVEAVVTDSNGETADDSHDFDIVGSCSVDYDGDDVTDFVSSDASAVRDGIAAAASGATVRVAGICEQGLVDGSSIALATIAAPLTLEGGYDATDWAAGADPDNFPTIFDASGYDRVIYLDDATDVTLANLILVNGLGDEPDSNFTPYNDNGGAIYAAQGDGFLLDSVTIANSTAAANGAGLYMEMGSLTIVDSQMSGNSAVYGGALYMITGTIAITDSQFTENSASYTLGGGIYAGDVTIHGGTVSDNNGTGLYVSDALVMTNSTVAGNQANTGAGIYSDGATVTIERSTISGNEATSFNAGGAGLYLNGGSLAMTNSTISGNTAENNSQNGGGLYNNGGDVVLTHVSVISNSASANGGGLYNGSGDIDLSYSIVANSVSGNDCSGTITDSRGNIASDSSCGFTRNTSLNNTDPLVDSLADNGGETETHAIQQNSPAIDQASNSNSLEDQRGVVRPQFAYADSGSYEFDYDYTADGCDPSPWVISDTVDLNQAITCFNGQSGGSATIQFAQGFVLGEATITISNSVTTLEIDGQGYTLDADDNSRHFNIEMGEVSITDITLKDGRMAANGGSVYVQSDAAVVLDGVTFESNSVYTNKYGGSIYNAGELSVSNSYFNQDLVVGDGGSIGNAGIMTLDKSTIYYSEANRGGGIYNESTGVMTVTNSTISEVYSYDVGGAIYNQGVMNIIHASIIDAYAEGDGVVKNNGGAVTMTLSILTTLGGDICDGTITDGGGNIAGDSTCGFTESTSMNNADPEVSNSLANNGGATQTYAISSSSSRSVNTAECVLDEDQRGKARPSGLYCDSGAYEFEFTDIPVTATISLELSGDVTLDWVTDASATNCDADVYQSGTPYSGHALWQSDLTAWSVTDNAITENSFYLVWLTCDNGEAAISNEIGVFHFGVTPGD